MAINITINIWPDKVQDVNLMYLWDFISVDRIKEKDKLINFESSIIRGTTYAQWVLDYEPIVEGMRLMKFLKKRLDRVQPIWPFLTLPRSNEPELDRVKALWEPYYNKYTYSLDSNYVNMPSGDLHPDYIFIGEAPGWKKPGEFNVPVYSYGKTSLLYRFLVSIIFGPKTWFTNISKPALEKNKKMTKLQLENNLNLLYSELEILKPATIICLGNYVYEKLSPIYNKLYKIYHPAYIYRQGNDAKMYAKNMIEVKNEISSIL